MERWSNGVAENSGPRALDLAVTLDPGRPLLQQVFEEFAFGEAIVFVGVVVHILGDAKYGSIFLDKLLEAAS